MQNITPKNNYAKQIRYKYTATLGIVKFLENNFCLQQILIISLFMTFAAFATIVMTNIRY